MSGLIVIDASVIRKGVLPPDAEPLTEGNVGVALPALWYFEVGNILIRNMPTRTWRICAINSPRSKNP
ncbi:hypothetical protein ACWJKU_16655 [Methylocaldum sp. MU1018]